MAFALRAAQVFDGEEVVDEPVVVIDGDSIVAVGNAAPDGVEVLDLGDMTLLPGLVDTHQHLIFNGIGTLEEQVDDVSDADLEQRARDNAGRALRAGVTTIRDLGDRNYVTLALRGDRNLPTILTAGPPITPEGGHCWFLGGCCTGADGLVAAVEERKRRGCDVVKIMVTGGALTPTYPMWVSQFTADEVKTVVEAAHRVELPVAAHCHGIDGIRHALAARVDTIEHCTYFTENGKSEPDDDLIEAIAASGITVSATLGRLPGMTPPPAIAANYDTMVAAMGKLRRLGGTIAAGTDAGVGPPKPHDVLPYAVADFAAVGMTPREMLATLTAGGADACSVGDRKGRLRAGYDADLLAVAGDPLADPDALHDVRGVWRAGNRVV
ncbi:MAG TPA: amidohydrolase family protein [Acidimicrobiales bacterium]|nr:amidohydrolase family protein [Acidimicrobiales bacterium]